MIGDIETITSDGVTLTKTVIHEIGDHIKVLRCEGWPSEAPIYMVRNTRHFTFARGGFVHAVDAIRYAEKSKDWRVR